MVETISKIHQNAFLKRERQSVERLVADMGREVVSKFDVLLLRDILYERKEREIEEILGEGAVPKDQRYRVMINLRSGKQQQVSTEQPPTKRQKHRYIERLKKSAQLACHGLETDLRKLGREAIRVLWLTHSVVAELNSEELEKIASRKDVANINAVKKQIVITLIESQPLIQADKVHQIGFDGTGITVAVIDTGVDEEHYALADVVTSQQDFTDEGIGDNNGHGTHCAGIIASKDARRRGIAPGAKIADIKIMDRFGFSDPEIAVAGIEAAVELGVDVASNSWGWSHGYGAWEDDADICVLCKAARNAVAQGVVFVVAAGNEDNNPCGFYDTHIRCPGNARSVITVGASDDNDNMAGFSSIGPTVDGRIKPDVVAPGVHIVSARASGTIMGSPIDDNWTSADGTSMACPHVAGVAALMLHKKNTLLPEDVRSTLMSTAVDIGATPNEMGAGRVDALAAVNAVL